MFGRQLLKAVEKKREGEQDKERVMERGREGASELSVVGLHPV